jgi:hypothetical protein
MPEDFRTKMMRKSFTTEELSAAEPQSDLTTDYTTHGISEFKE